MAYRFSTRSASRLAECHPDLQALMNAVIESADCPCDVTVLCGFRGEVDQNAAYDAGRSKLRFPQSKHNKTPSHAVDVAPYVGGAVSWDWDHYHPLAAHVKATWERLEREGALSGRFRLTWGGDWTSLRDGPHWQIDPVAQ